MFVTIEFAIFLPHSAWCSHTKDTFWFCNVCKVNREAFLITFACFNNKSFAESRSANPVQTHSANDFDGLIKPPRDKVSRYSDEIQSCFRIFLHSEQFDFSNISFVT